MKSRRAEGRRRWDRWKWTKRPRGPGTPPRSQRRNKEAGESRDGGDGLALPGSEPPWCNSNFRWRNDWEILKKPGRRTLKRREEEEEAAAGPR